ncbi:MAG: PIG-L deacetylase family protein [Actinomycetota bacterium]|nr:PIG-L deacetylase family protein [Actinomycetota bacterium]
MKHDLPLPRSALVIAAHPDDAEFQCGATLAKWSAAGTVVHHLVCTDGSKGTWDRDTDQDSLVEIRKSEQRNAAACLGATGQLLFLDKTDGELQSDLVTRSAVTKVIRELRPQVVLGHDPWKRYRLHPDHRHAGFLAVDGVVAARDPFFFPEHGLKPHRPEVLLLFEADEHDHAEDVDGWGEAKAAALLEHKSQFLTTHKIDDPDDESQITAFRDRIEENLAAAGELSGLKSAELFKAIFDL